MTNASGDLTTGLGFMAAEDNALWSRLQGITVADNKNAARPVKVRWNFPSPTKDGAEIQYPYILIEELDVVPARDRAHSGLVQPSYVPDLYSSAGDVADYGVRLPHYRPVNLLYQISTSTDSRQVDRQLMQTLMGRDFLPTWGGFVDVGDDGTTRRLDVVAGPRKPSGVDQRNRRVYRNVWTVSLYAELNERQLAASSRVREVLFSEDFSEDHAYFIINVF